MNEDEVIEKLTSDHHMRRNHWHGVIGIDCIDSTTNKCPILFRWFRRDVA